LDPDTVTLRGACSGNQRVGGFVITSTPQTPKGYVGGTVKDGLDPEQLAEVVASADGCQLLKRPRYTCDPGCESGSVCNSDGECQKMARTQSLGPVTLRGLGAPLELKPKVPGNAYFQETPRVPAAGAPLELTTTEGYAGETALYGLGVAPLELTVGFWVLRADKPLLVRWAAPPQGSRTRIRVELSVDQHGTTPIALACDWDDDGEGSVPKDLVAQLLEAGVTGFPSGTVTRFTADSVKVPSGCMDLLVSSSESPAVQVSGYTPCTSTNQCPKDQICNTQLERCE
jgi:hypothetical protein